MLCPHCHTENPEGMVFCGKCGQKLAVCPHCHCVNPDGMVFCGKCGARLDAAPAAAEQEISATAERPDRNQYALWAFILGLMVLFQGIIECLRWCIPYVFFFVLQHGVSIAPIIILGIMGLRHAKSHPGSKGVAFSIICIGAGAVAVILNVISSCRLFHIFRGMYF